MTPTVRKGEPHPGLPLEHQSSKQCLYCLPVHVGRDLDWKQNTLDSNQHSHTECWCGEWRSACRDSACPLTCSMYKAHFLHLVWLFKNVSWINLLNSNYVILNVRLKLCAYTALIKWQTLSLRMMMVCFSFHQNAFFVSLRMLRNFAPAWEITNSKSLSYIFC